MPKELFNYDNFNRLAGVARESLVGAAQQATKIANEARDLNIEVYNNAASKASAALAPFLQAGKQSAEELSNLLGLNGSSKQAQSTQRILNSPQVQQMIKKGTENVQSSAAAQGRLGTGRVLEELFRVGQDASVSEVARNQNLLLGFAGQGQQAASAEAQIQSNLGAQIGQGNLFAADVAGNSALAIGNANAAFYNQQAQIDMQRQLDRYSFGAPGGLGGQPDLMGGAGVNSAGPSGGARFATSGFPVGQQTGRVGNTIYYGDGSSAPVADGNGGGLF